MSHLRTRSGLVLVAIVALAAGLAHPAWGQARERSAPELAALWAKLDAARAYRGSFAQRDGDTRKRVLLGGKSHEEILGDYVECGPAAPPPCPGTTPRDALAELIGPAGFPMFTGPGIRRGLRQEAANGVQEALSEFMAGEALVANEKLLQGLRTRYPGQGDPGDATQQSLLEHSVARFFAAVNRAGDSVRNDPAGFRAAGIVNPTFAFFVENTPRPGSGQGEIVEADYYRYTDLVNRYGIAANALAKRKFFFGNDDPDGRADAASDFKNGAQAVYLNSVLLAAGQSPSDFQSNNGGELDRQITTAQQLYDDIQSGFNPLTLRGDFVPAQSTNGLMDIVEGQLLDATCSERDARNAARLYDTDQTALVEELRKQTESYIDQIDILLGFLPPFPRPGDTQCDPPEQLACDFALPEHRDRLLAIADDEKTGQRAIDYLSGCDATICNNYRSWQAAQQEYRQAQKASQNITEQIKIEEGRTKQVTRIITATGIAISAIELAEGIAVAAVPEITTEASVPPSVSTTFPVSAAISGVANAGVTTEEWLRDVFLEQTESSATIRNLLLELAAESLSAKRAALAVVEARAEYTASIGDLNRFLRNYAGSRAELADAFFTNPAYQLALDRAAQNADSDFEAAMVVAYKATKALEYEWAERLANPVLDPNGVDRPIGDVTKFNPIVSAESVFTVRSAGSPETPAPMLRTYVEALQLWDTTMRQVRGPARQAGNRRVVSLKRDILGFDSPDEAFNRIAFRSYVASHRVPGTNPSKEDLVVEFPLQIFDQKHMPAEPNLKILSLAVDLKTVPGRMLLARPDPNPPLVDLVMDDQALLRTFFADYPNDDDFLTIELEGFRSYRDSKFRATVETTIDEEGTTAPNTQLADRSPAVSRWVLWIDMENNTELLLENLDDIEITFNVTFGRPVEFDFPDVLACP